MSKFCPKLTLLVHIEAGREARAVAWEMRSLRASRNPAQGIGAQVEQEIVKEVIIVGRRPGETTRTFLAQEAKVARRHTKDIEEKVETVAMDIKDLALPLSSPTSSRLS